MRRFLKNVPPADGFHTAGQEPVFSGAGWDGEGGLGPVPELWAFPLSLMILGRHTKKHSALPKEYHEPFIHGPPYEKPYIPS